MNSVTFNASSTYTRKYSAQYNLEVVNVATTGSGPWTVADVTFEITVTPQSGGNDQANKVPQHSAMVYPSEDAVIFMKGVVTPVTDYQLSLSYSAVFTDGIKLNFAAYDGTNYLVGDNYTWKAYGPGRIEISSANLNTNQFSTVDEPVQGTNEKLLAGVLDPPDPDLFDSSGVVTINDFTDYSYAFNRSYKFRVANDTSGSTPSGDGPLGNREFDLYWSAYSELPYTEGVVSVDEAVAASYTKVLLEHGVYVDINLGAGHKLEAIAVDGMITKPEVITAAIATSLATAIVLARDARLKFNYHDASLYTSGSTPFGRHLAGVSNHQVTTVPTTEATMITCCQQLQAAYTAHIGDDVMHDPVDSIWALASITPVDLATCITFLNDFKVKYRRHMIAFNFVAGDTWTMDAFAARQDYTAKDDRNYTLTVGTVVYNTSIPIAWYTDTYEGRFGSFTTPATNIYVEFPDTILLAIRNFPTSGSSERFLLNDKFTFSTVCEDTIDWNLRTRVNETIPEASIRQDTLGRITGVPLSYYIIVSDTPETIIRVVDADTGALLSYSLILDLQGNPTPYIMFLGAKPTADILVYYEHRGKEPSPAQYYYITANRLRTDAEYEVPTIYYSRDTMEAGLAPKTTDNQLWIAGDIQFDTAFFGGYYCQVKDASGDLEFSPADYRRAIDATEATSEITDLTVVGYYPATSYAKASIEKMADPFVKSERMLWVGAPIGTPIGNTDTPDTLVYLAKKTLQFSGDNPGRGHVVLAANPRVTRTIVLDDNSIARVDLDGSFLAAYTAARNAAFIQPSDVLLRKDVASFEDMDVFNEAEQLILGSSSILYCNPVGAGGFRYEESMTVDTSAPDLSEISAMNQKMYVTKLVARDMDEALVSVVPPSPAAGVAMIQAFLCQELGSIASSGVIAPYGSEIRPNPTTRQVSPSSDLFVFIDELDPTLYHFGYFFNIRYPIKRLFGLYSVDTKFWDAR